LEQVTLASPDGLKLFDRLDLTIQAGRRVALLTSEPTAAMALAGLLVRLYDPAAGRILYDDFDIAHATLDTVRGQSLLVPADGMLFGGTVQENISCGDAGFTMLQVADAAKQARAQSFLLDLPRGFSTHIGENGVRLSAIQAFHIGLARALLRDPSILIVAEPPNEPDEAAHVRLDEALRLAAAERTMIVIPTRRRSLRAAQDVIVLHEGRVAAIGSHTELLKASSLYRHLNYVRFHAFRAIR
jgi:ATP-binding cassette, subfamily B, bacterial